MRQVTATGRLSTERDQRRVLLITLSNIGDLVMTTPTLEALHAVYPGALVDIVADRRSSALLTHCPYLGTLYHREKAGGRRGFFALLSRLRQQRYEAVIDLRTDFVPWLLRARARSCRWQARRSGPHAVEQHYAVLARLLPTERDIPPARVWWDDGSERKARALLAQAPGRRLVIAPGANWAGKIWQAARYAELAGALVGDFGSLVLVGNEREQQAASVVASGYGKPVLNLCGQLTLLETTAVLAQCDAFIGNDSGLGHLAAACTVPTLTIFGPGEPQRYRPWGPRADIVLAPDRDLSQLTVATVLEAFRAQHSRLAANLTPEPGTSRSTSRG